MLQADGAPAANSEIIVVHVACRAHGSTYALGQKISGNEVEARGADGLAQLAVLLSVVERHDFCGKQQAKLLLPLLN